PGPQRQAPGGAPRGVDLRRSSADGLRRRIRGGGMSALGVREAEARAPKPKPSGLRLLPVPRRRSRPRLRAVRRRDPRVRRWVLWLLASVVIGGLLVGIVATQALVNQTSFHMHDLQAKAKALRQRNAELTLRVADLSAPDRIVAAARALGLGLP